MQNRYLPRMLRVCVCGCVCVCMQIDTQAHKVLNFKQGFPGGAVVKNPPANAGDMGSSSGQGRSHMLWSK